MSEQTLEPEAKDEEGVVLEEDEEDRARMQELDERIEQEGIQGGEPDDATRGGFGTPQTMIAEAKKHLGYRETGTNDTKFNRWLGSIPGYGHGGFGYPWCHAFISYCLAHSDNAGAGPKTAGCLAGVAWFKKQNRFVSEPKVGDIVYFGQGGGTHVELVVGVGPGTIKTIGGNTSGSVGGQKFFNGDGVYEKSVKRTSRIFGYGRPSYSSGGGAAGGGAAAGTAKAAAAKLVKPMTTLRSIRQQQEAVNSLGFTPKLDVDGEWGPKSEAGVKWLQKKVGAGADGEWGEETERLFKAFKP